MTETQTFYAQLPEGYTKRVPARLARSTRGRFTRAWYFMLRDLYEGGGYGWQRWGGGHISSGITKALTSRRYIETAESTKGPLLFRLTRRGEDKLMELYEEHAESAERSGEEYVLPTPPEGAPRQPLRQERKLTAEDAEILAIWQDELAGIERGIESFDELLKTEDAPFADRAHRIQLVTRQVKLQNQINHLRYED